VELVTDQAFLNPFAHETSGFWVRAFFLEGSAARRWRPPAGNPLASAQSWARLAESLAPSLVTKSVRGWLKALRVPDFVVAIVEDAVAIGGGLFLLSRF